MIDSLIVCTHHTDQITHSLPRIAHSHSSPLIPLLTSIDSTSSLACWIHCSSSLLLSCDLYSMSNTRILKCSIQSIACVRFSEKKGVAISSAPTVVVTRSCSDGSKSQIYFMNEHKQGYEWYWEFVWSWQRGAACGNDTRLRANNWKMRNLEMGWLHKKDDGSFNEHCWRWQWYSSFIMWVISIGIISHSWYLNSG